MKGFARKIAAISAAVVMSVSAFGANISAFELREDFADSWVMTDKGWVFVMPDGNDAVNRLLKIDGVMYKFGSRAHDYERYTGWTKSSDGIKRRYADGLPYTGWLKYKNGQRRYCLDGYIATSNMQIGDYLYTFDKDGFYYYNLGPNMIGANVAITVNTPSRNYTYTQTDGTSSSNFKYINKSIISSANGISTTLSSTTTQNFFLYFCSCGLTKR